MGCFSTKPPQAPEAPSTQDIIRDVGPLMALQIAGGAGQASGPGGTVRRGSYDPEGNFVAFDPGQYVNAVMNGDLTTAMEMLAASNVTEFEENPEQAALRNVGRETQTQQNMLGQMILGQLLGGDIPLSGYQNEVAPPMGFTPWQDTEANPFPTYQPPAPEHWDNWAIPLEAISLGSPYGRYETHPNRGG